jgi:hypothetical protein
MARKIKAVWRSQDTEMNARKAAGKETTIDKLKTWIRETSGYSRD